MLFYNPTSSRVKILNISKENEQQEKNKKTFHVSYFYSCFADATVVQTWSIHSNIFKHQAKEEESFNL